MHKPSDIALDVLDASEVGVAVVDTEGQAIYMNDSAKSLLASSGDVLPDWANERLQPMLEVIATTGAQAVERWPSPDFILRVRARPLKSGVGLRTLEITVAHAAGGRQITEQLARALQLSLSDARLLSLLWRGMSNEEIAQTLCIRNGTVKSRLFRLYQKLGVKRRPAAVLRAAEVLAS
jgi:DNA-binding NarL/FixJ family response regulator